MDLCVTKNVPQDRLKPFVKWVGGKRGVLPELLKRIPAHFDRYYEPFVGGGALFFELLPQKACISDLNSELIAAYESIKNTPQVLMDLLDEHYNNHSEEYFYHLRGQTKFASLDEVAARFIYLNKTCYNGLYRVNKQGKFNSPFGKYIKGKFSLYDAANLIAVSNYLKGVEISCQSYEKIKPQKEDFVYFDPPYYSVYTQYTDKNFCREDQEQLAQFVNDLSQREVKVMLSNSNTDFIKTLYKNYNISIISAPRSVNCKGNNRTGQEVIITNYDS